jgi:hypothetical protein
VFCLSTFFKVGVFNFDILSVNRKERILGKECRLRHPPKLLAKWKLGWPWQRGGSMSGEGTVLMRFRGGGKRLQKKTNYEIASSSTSDAIFGAEN